MEKTRFEYYEAISIKSSCLEDALFLVIQSFDKENTTKHNCRTEFKNSRARFQSHDILSLFR